MSNPFPEKPINIKVKHFNDYITIIKTWFGCTTWFFTLNSLVWFSITLPLILLNVEFENLMALPYVLAGIIFVIVSILLLYSTIALWINKTYLIINKQGIIVRHKPIPCPKLHNNVYLRYFKLKNLYSKAKVSDSSSTYEICAKTHNNTDKKIIKTNNQKEIIFLEKTLKDYLNLKDNQQ